MNSMDTILLTYVRTCMEDHADVQINYKNDL